jgi:hypothetical protein
VAAVSLEDMIAATTLGGNGSHRPLRFTGMTAVEVLGSVDELTDGTVRSIDRATEARIDHIGNRGSHLAPGVGSHGGGPLRSPMGPLAHARHSAPGTRLELAKAVLDYVLPDLGAEQGASSVHNEKIARGETGAAVGRGLPRLARGQGRESARHPRRVPHGVPAGEAGRPVSLGPRV